LKMRMDIGIGYLDQDIIQLIEIINGLFMGFLREKL